MKFGQLIELTWNIFLEQLYTKCGADTSRRPFLKNENWVYLWVNNLKSYTVCFYFMPSLWLSKHIETKLQTTCFYLILSFFENPEEI